MRKKNLRFIFPLILLTILIVQWFNIFFIGGIIGVVSWWSVYFGSIVSLIIFAFLLIMTPIKLIRHKRIHLHILLSMIISLIMCYPICWFFHIGQIAYPVDISSIKPAVSIRLPINKPTVVGWGGNTLETNQPHVIAPMERFGYDLLMKPLSTKSKNLNDYGIYNTEVVSPADGTIVEAYDKENDILPGSEDNKTMAGNHIYIQLDETRTYLFIAHLKKDSILVKKGQHVKEGTPIARVGNSGSSSEPHLHIHHQRQNPATTNMFLSEGLPLYFRNINGPMLPKGGPNGDIISPK